MNLFAHFDLVIKDALNAMAEAGELPQGLDVSRVVAEPPRDAAHGDVATNAALVLAKGAGRPPRQIAEALAARLAGHADIAGCDVAGPGFINLHLEAAFWPQVLAAVLEQGDQFGHSTLGAGKKVNVEYVSVNPTGPLHVGHGRGAVFGDALANLLAQTGHAVTREYYINDAGIQVDVLARSAHLRYREALGEDIGEIPAGLYPADYLKPVGEKLAANHGKSLISLPEEEWLPVVRDLAISMMMDLIRSDLASLNVYHEVFFSERTLHAQGTIAKALDDLRARGLVYQGSLPPPKGALPPDWEDREQTLFKASEFGDDMDRPLAKSDGSYTYFAADVAYTRDKIGRGFDELVYMLGADHGGYVKRLQALANVWSGGKVRTVVRLCQMVKLFRDGEPVKMSKRSGEFVTLRDVVDEVGPDVLRFMMLTRKNDAPLDFDFARVTEQSKDNPVFYVQYAHARICSVFRNASQEGIDADCTQKTADIDFSLLQDSAEKALISRLAAYPRMLEAAAIAHEPHRIAFYLYDLAGEFHALWNKGKVTPQLRFILTNDLPASAARLALLRAIRYILANGLRILGVKPAGEM